MAGWNWADPFPCQEASHRHNIYNPCHAAWAVSLCSKYWLLQPTWQGKPPTGPTCPLSFKLAEAQRWKILISTFQLTTTWQQCPFSSSEFMAQSPLGDGGRGSLTLFGVQWRIEAERPEFCSLSEDRNWDGHNRKVTLYCQAQTPSPLQIQGLMIDRQTTGILGRSGIWAFSLYPLHELFIGRRFKQMPQLLPGILECTSEVLQGQWADVTRSEGGHFMAYFTECPNLWPQII